MMTSSGDQTSNKEAHAERIRPGFAALNSIGEIRDISPSTQVLVEVAVALLARSD